ncbi:MAG: AfsR/SARP family transcriptional regulator, partial [Actinomycetes bacterium]
MSGKLTYAILGTLEIKDGRRIVPIAAAKQRILLACLLLDAGRQTSLTELYEALWGDDPPAAPKAAVHNYMGRLRKVLGDEGIETTPNGYRLVVEPGRVDLLRFRRLVGQARQFRRNGDLLEESRVLGEALALWRGPALADVPSERLQRYEVPGLTEERISALERRIAVDLDLGLHADLTTELRVLTTRFPLRERFWSQLILALHRDDRSVEALSVYH